MSRLQPFVPGDKPLHGRYLYKDYQNYIMPIGVAEAMVRNYRDFDYEEEVKFQYHFKSKYNYHSGPIKVSEIINPIPTLKQLVIGFPLLVVPYCSFGIYNSPLGVTCHIALLAGMYNAYHYLFEYNNSLFKGINDSFIKKKYARNHTSIRELLSTEELNESVEDILQKNKKQMKRDDLTFTLVNTVGVFGALKWTLYRLSDEQLTQMLHYKDELEYTVGYLRRRVTSILEFFKVERAMDADYRPLNVRCAIFSLGFGILYYAVRSYDTYSYTKYVDEFKWDKV